MQRKKENRPAYQPSILNWRENQDPEKEEAHYSFPKGTPMWRDGNRSMVNAEQNFVAKRIEGEIAGYSAFKLIGSVKVYFQRGWAEKKYFYLKAGQKLGLKISSEGYRPTKLK